MTSQQAILLSLGTDLCHATLTVSPSLNRITVVDKLRIKSQATECGLPVAMETEALGYCLGKVTYLCSRFLG